MVEASIASNIEPANFSFLTTETHHHNRFPIRKMEVACIDVVFLMPLCVNIGSHRQ